MNLNFYKNKLTICSTGDDSRWTSLNKRPGKILKQKEVLIFKARILELCQGTDHWENMYGNRHEGKGVWKRGTKGVGEMRKEEM